MEKLLSMRFASPDEAFAAIEAESLDKGAFRCIPDQGEFILIARSEAPKADAEKPAKAKAPKAPKPAKAAKPSKAKGPKAEAPKAAKGASDEMALKAAARRAEGRSGPLSDRRWLGDWAKLESDAKAGRLPKLGASANLAEAKSEEWQKAAESAFGGIFSANTHWPFRKRIAALAALIRAKDEKGLKSLIIKEISTTPIMLGKLRDLAIAALKADKPSKAKHEGNGAAAAPAEGEAPQAQA